MMNSATNRLKEFQAEHNAYTKGLLSISESISTYP